MVYTKLIYFEFIWSPCQKVCQTVDLPGSLYSKVGQGIMIMVQLAQLKLQHVMTALARHCAVESMRR